MHDSAVASVSLRARHASSTISSTGRSSSREQVPRPARGAPQAHRPRSSPGVDDQVDVDLEVTGADGRLHPTPLAARLRQHACDRGLAHAVEAQRAPLRRLGPREHAPHAARSRRALGQSRRSSRGGPGRATTTHAPVARARSPGAVPASPSEAAPSGNDACLRHAGRELAVRPPEPLGDAARHSSISRFERSDRRRSVAPRRAREQLDRAVVVRRPEAAGDDEQVGANPSSSAALQLVRPVADDRHAGRLEPARIQLPRPEKARCRSARSPRTSSRAGDDDGGADARQEASRRRPPGETTTIRGWPVPGRARREPFTLNITFAGASIRSQTLELRKFWIFPGSSVPA